MSLSSMPLVFYSGYACDEESNTTHNNINWVYPLPEETTAGTGLLGTIHNNTAIDMAPWELDNEPELEAGTYNTTSLGFICAAHTSHSTDVGRVGRLCTGATVRVSDALVQDQYVHLAESLCNRTFKSKHSDNRVRYLVFVCGYYAYFTEAETEALCTEVVDRSEGRKKAITCHMYRSAKLLVLSDSSGVVLRPHTAGKYGDNLCFNKVARGSPQVTTHMKPTSDSSALDFQFSAFFQLWPYVEYDRPPQPLLSSGQILQAMALPWAANVSSTSYEDEGATEVACIPGGINVSMCLANLSNTYEDCIGVSRKAAEKGLFSHVNLCTFSLPGNTPIPPKGCECYKSQVWGVLYNTIQESDGSISVKAMRYARAVTGNKLATPHGQKGVMYIMEESKMPVGVLDDGSKIEFDVVMSLSSVVNIQTLGQYFEMVRGELAQKGLDTQYVIGATERETQHHPIVTHRKTPECPTVIAPQPNSLSPMVDRSRGGAVRFGEMESLAMAASGSLACLRE
ncbi:DNA-directed RNA polymerase, partial [Puccinia sorghi]